MDSVLHPMGLRPVPPGTVYSALRLFTGFINPALTAW
jgi:hypothetical protein